MNIPQIDIVLPPAAKARVFTDILDSLSELFTDLMIYLCYGIALLCGLKFIIYILNGIAAKSHLGTQSLDYPSFLR